MDIHYFILTTFVTFLIRLKIVVSIDPFLITKFSDFYICRAFSLYFRKKYGDFRASKGRFLSILDGRMVIFKFRNDVFLSF